MRLEVITLEYTTTKQDLDSLQKFKPEELEAYLDGMAGGHIGKQIKDYELTHEFSQYGVKTYMWKEQGDYKI